MTADAGGSERFAAQARPAAELARLALRWFEAAAPSLRRLATGLRLAAGVGVAASLLIAVMVGADLWPLGWVAVLSLVIVLAVLLAGPYGVWRFATGVQGLAELPAWLAGSPELLARHTDQLAAVYRDTVGRYGEASHFRVFGGGLVRAGRVLLGVRKEFFDYETVAGLTSWAFVVWAVLGLVEILFTVLLVPVVAATVVLT